MPVVCIRRHTVITLMTFFFAFASSALAKVEVIGTYYRADQAYPRYRAFWHEDSNMLDEVERAEPPVANNMRLGASLHVYIRNDSDRPLVIEDVKLAGISLNEAIANSGQRLRKEFANIYFSKLPHTQLQELIDLGEPVWWKVDPATLAPGRTGEVIVRLREQGAEDSVTIELVGKHGSAEFARQVPVKVIPVAPRIAGISFLPGLREMYMYFRHPQERGLAPARILMDGRDITAQCNIGRDDAISLVPVVVRLPQPLEAGSYHVFAGEYEDGSRALAGVRAWRDDFVYGMFGGKPGSEEQPELGRQYFDDLAAHNFNTQMPQLGSAAVQAFLRDPAGKRYFAERGFRSIPNAIGKWGLSNPLAYYVHDEPDCGDDKAKDLPADKKIGSMARYVIAYGNEIRAKDPAVPQMLNLNMSFKPTNWHTYGQIPDIFSVDPYYQSRLKSAYTTNPERIPLYLKATYVYAVGVLAGTASEPRPVHVILNCVRHVDKQDRRKINFRFATPEEKRIEVYYALAAGAKGLSYWWYSPVVPAYGVGAATSDKPDPEAAALWREMGLLGAEARTIGPVVLDSCPIDIAVKTPKNVWVRCLAAGTRTLVLLVVNDDYQNTDKGTAYKPVDDVELAVPLPAWLKNPAAFEVSPAGIQDVMIQPRPESLRVSLGKLDIARMIVITSDTSLRAQLEGVYSSKFAASTAALLKE